MGAAAMLTGSVPAGAVAGPFEDSEFDRLVPSDKKLDSAWVKSLYERGESTVYRGEDLALIGMPVGGLCSGQLYLGGDGKLWHWDIFNRVEHTDDAHYAHPLRPKSPLEQGFAVRIHQGDTVQVRSLDREGFSDIRFRGEYPIGFVEYRDPVAPVAVTLEAFSPFIPLNTDDSSLPATILTYHVRNVSGAPVAVELAGWLQNAICLDNVPMADGYRVNRVVRDGASIRLDCRAEPVPDVKGQTPRPPVTIATFDGDTYLPWKAEGEAFGRRPSTGAPTPEQHLNGFEGKGLVNSWTGTDATQGRLTSPAFTIERDFINFLIGGGNHPGETCINLLADGKVVRTATGRDIDTMEWTAWDVRDLADKVASIEILDRHSGGWGHIDIDSIEQSDVPRKPPVPLAKRHDFGTMCLALLKPLESDRGDARVPHGSLANAVFPHDTGSVTSIGTRITGALTRSMTLEPGQDASATIVVTWHFPNLSLPGTRLPADLGRHYATRFRDAADVVRYVAANFARLDAETRLWHRTWYDSTLPHWFLERTFANTSILATSTCQRFRDGRFYGWEGVGCCAGTCTHVWHYAQAVARLFPELERILRERVDYAEGIGFDPKTGIISHRAEEPVGPAVDGQAGNILRAYREHQMSADGAFLERLWPKVKASLEYLIRHDPNADGLLEGAQHNTLDAQWFGVVPWLSSLYIAALTAGAAMAREMKDEAFANRCRRLAELGSKNLVGLLWNEDYDYFVQRADQAHARAVGSYDGCEIDQVFGQHWAFQVGLGRILDREHVVRALRSLWRYNFTPDVGPYRRVHEPGRWYAMPGEAGLLMVTFPKGNGPKIDDPAGGWSAMYFNECMNGFEYQVAGHMIWEGLVQEGLAITRAIHDRYHASKRNPWNEVECGDHYARSMASYGVFLAACGYEYHGPLGFLAFHPRLSPDDFRTAFTTAEGWGTFSQQRHGPRLSANVAVRWGRLRLRSLGLGIADRDPTSVTVRVNGRPVPRVTTRRNAPEETIELRFPEELVIGRGEELAILLD
jgi:uncharacterized protein (DUF608 family)